MYSDKLYNAFSTIDILSPPFSTRQIMVVHIHKRHANAIGGTCKTRLPYGNNQTIFYDIDGI